MMGCVIVSVTTTTQTATKIHTDYWIEQALLGSLGWAPLPATDELLPGGTASRVWLRRPIMCAAPLNFCLACSTPLISCDSPAYVCSAAGFLL